MQLITAIYSSGLHNSVKNQIAQIVAPCLSPADRERVFSPDYHKGLDKQRFVDGLKKSSPPSSKHGLDDETNTDFPEIGEDADARMSSGKRPAEVIEPPVAASQPSSSTALNPNQVEAVNEPSAEGDQASDPATDPVDIPAGSSSELEVPSGGKRLKSKTTPLAPLPADHVGTSRKKRKKKKSH